MYNIFNLTGLIFVRVRNYMSVFITTCLLYNLYIFHVWFIYFDTFAYGLLHKFLFKKLNCCGEYNIGIYE